MIYLFFLIVIKPEWKGFIKFAFLDKRSDKKCQTIMDFLREETRASGRKKRRRSILTRLAEREELRNSYRLFSKPDS